MRHDPLFALDANLNEIGSDAQSSGFVIWRMIGTIRFESTSGALSLEIVVRLHNGNEIAAGRIDALR